MAKALETCLTYNNLNDRTFLNDSLSPFGFSLDGFDPSSETANADFEALENFDNAPSYSFDLNIQDGEIIGQPYAGTIPEPEDYRSKLICSVKRKNAEFESVDTVPVNERVPVGHFIVNKATLRFQCAKPSSETALTQTLTRRHIMIGILQVKDVELIGCVHEIPTFLDVEESGVFQLCFRLKCLAAG